MVAGREGGKQHRTRGGWLGEGGRLAGEFSAGRGASVVRGLSPPGIGTCCKHMGKRVGYGWVGEGRRGRRGGGGVLKLSWTLN